MKSPFIKLDEAKCHHCMKCVRACPTGAMSYIGSKPVIADEDCILCGRCIATCTRGAQKVTSEFSRVERWLKRGEDVILSVDPAFAAIWPDFKALKALLIGRGFKVVEETAKGAAAVSAVYADLIAQHKMRNIITTACPAVNTMIEREFPDLIDQMAPVASPEMIHAKMLRQKNLGAKIVFLTPCIAAYREIKDSRFAGLFDVCISTVEMAAWIRNEYTGRETKDWGEFDGSIARMYPTCGGIIKTLEPSEHYKFMAVDGIGRIRNMLNSIRRGELNNCFIEVSACRGSCIAGPLNSEFEHNEWVGQQRILAQADQRKITAKDRAQMKTDVQWRSIGKERREFTNKEIQTVMARMGKTSPEKIYNCGVCGYETCVDKAKAVLMGRADPKICLPEALSHAQSMANRIIEATPNGIIVFDDTFEVSDVNKAALQMLGESQEDLVGRSVFEVFPTGAVANAVTEMHARNQYSRNWYECYQKLFDEIVIHVADRNQTVVILMDRTDEDARITEMQNMRERTLKVTQDVIDAQMRSVQEIASLLGETTAKSKIALLNLQRVMDEGKNNG